MEALLWVLLGCGCAFEHSYCGFNAMQRTPVNIGIRSGFSTTVPLVWMKVLSFQLTSQPHCRCAFAGYVFPMFLISFGTSPGLVALKAHTNAGLYVQRPVTHAHADSFLDEPILERDFLIFSLAHRWVRNECL